MLHACVGMFHAPQHFMATRTWAMPHSLEPNAKASPRYFLRPTPRNRPASGALSIPRRSADHANAFRSTTPPFPPITPHVLTPEIYARRSTDSWCSMGHNKKSYSTKRSHFVSGGWHAPRLRGHVSRPAACHGRQDVPHATQPLPPVSLPVPGVRRSTSPSCLGRGSACPWSGVGQRQRPLPS